MAIARDASSPATVLTTYSALNSQSGTTAAFNPPANTLLTLTLCVDCGTATPTLTTPTNTGTALTWAKISQNLTTSGGVVLWEAFNASSQTGITVTTGATAVGTGNAAGNASGFYLDVWTGANSNQAAAATPFTGSSATSPYNPSQVNAVDQSQTVAIFIDDNGSGVPTTTDTGTGFISGSNTGGIRAYKSALNSGTGNTVVVNATRAAPSFHTIVFEIVPASSDVTIALTGQGATFNAGTMTPSTTGPVTVALTGQAATFSAGTMIASGGTVPPVSRSQVSMPGNPALSSPTNSLQFLTLRSFTTFNANVTVGLAGQAATFAAGTMANSASIALTGQASTFSAGTMLQGLSFALTGSSATFAAGLMAPASSIALTGQSATFAAGTMLASSAGGNVTVAMTGQAATFVAGSMAPGLALGLTGQSATFAAGTMSFGGISVSLHGQAATFRAGNMTPSGGTPVIGPQVTLVGFIANVGSMMVH